MAAPSGGNTDCTPGLATSRLMFSVSRHEIGQLDLWLLDVSPKSSSEGILEEPQGSRGDSFQAEGKSVREPTVGEEGVSVYSLKMFALLLK